MLCFVTPAMSFWSNCTLLRTGSKGVSLHFKLTVSYVTNFLRLWKTPKFPSDLPTEWQEIRTHRQHYIQAYSIYDYDTSQDGSNDKYSDLYSEGSRFEFRPGSIQHWLKTLVIFVSPTRNIIGNKLSHRSSFLKSLQVIHYLPPLSNSRGARGSVVGWGVMLQAGRLRVQVPMRSLDFFQLT
jgi:hypothetical protein